MHLINGRLDTPQCRVSAAFLNRLAADCADEEDGLEHVYTQVDPRGADIVLFLLQPDAAAATAAADRLLRRMLGSEALHDWRLVHHTGLLPRRTDDEH
ncbi:hypothetical protein [Streptomyces sp. NPDC001678]|uniref:hypothetical protein n=1 Tax=Streptomyces sp. NPDC001678 TaxID=3364599 RepID=UPI0036BDA957